MEKNTNKEQKEQYERELTNQKWEAIGSLEDTNNAWMIQTAYQITKKPYRKNKGRRF